MGIFSAMFTAVSGLRAQSFALENIAGNIANAQTIAYKRLDTGFADLVASSSSLAGLQTGGGVVASSRPTNGLQGTISQSTLATHVAINGGGYFTVQAKTGETDGRATFLGADLYTRRGDFGLDREGHLVNGAQYYLMGHRLDPETGNPVGGTLEPVTITGDVIPAETTTAISYRANLPAFPLVAGADRAVTGSELLDPADYAGDPRVGGTGQVQAGDVDTFLAQTISGGAVTIYDANGTPVNVQMRWAKVESAGGGGTDTWNLFYLKDSTATGADPAWQNVGTDYQFDADGKLVAPTGPVTIPALTVDGVEMGDIRLDHGDGLTQFDDSQGTARITELGQDGLPAGELVGFGIRDGGRIFQSYSNGKQVDVALIPLVAFTGEEQLQRLDGGAYAATPGSGLPLAGAPGTIVGQALEASNTDIAEEFSKLIVTQQAYSANGRVLSTSNDMMQDVLNIVR